MFFIRRGFRIWFYRYLPAEIVGTTLALLFASYTFMHTGSYLLATAAGLTGEGIGFYGFVIVRELITTSRSIKKASLLQRTRRTLRTTTANLLVEFTTAEILNTLFVRPVLLYTVPHYITPYALGFFVGKFGSDVFFYIVALGGYMLNEWRCRKFIRQKRRSSTATRA
ncbi:hypothetical protein KC949_02360 [Candidatus Saccharibacteria bacterium]|jgi:hypothetical protein|nr:hypothetical protein [Candidatus Saccharibacteria bacterium]